MTRTLDILKEMGENKGGRLLVGFALETDDIIENAKKKLTKKNLDMIVANNTEALASGVNQATILYKERETEPLPTLNKEEVSELILERISELKKGPGEKKEVDLPPPLPFNKRN